MYRRTFACALAFLSLAVLTGCPSGQPNRRRTKPAPAGDSTPQKTFAKVNESILKGDLETAYGLISSNQKATLTLEQFREDCRVNKVKWDLQLKGAVLTVVSYDDDGINASGMVIFGDGVKGVVDFVREDGIWRENGFYGLNSGGN